MVAAQGAPLLERLGARHPIILAPMFGASGPDLQAAVANAGGFAFFPGGWLPDVALRAGLKAARAQVSPSAPPLGVNIWASAMMQDSASWSDAQAEAAAEAARRQAMVFEDLHAPPPAAAPPTPAEAEAIVEGQVGAIIEEGVKVASIHFGWLAPHQVRRLLDAGVYLIGNATNVAEAQALERGGACAIIAQGAEAGGHRGTFLNATTYHETAMLSTKQLVRDVAAAVSVPVIAAGGIMSGSDVCAMLGAGAQAAMLGTAFLSAPESLIHEEHRRALLRPAGVSAAARTVVTQAFTGKPARAIVNGWTEDMDELQSQLPNCFNGLPGGRPLAAAAAKAGRTDLMTMWAGAGYARSRALPAAELVTAIAREAEALAPAQAARLREVSLL